MHIAQFFQQNYWKVLCWWHTMSASRATGFKAVIRLRPTSSSITSKSCLSIPVVFSVGDIPMIIQDTHSRQLRLNGLDSLAKNRSWSSLKLLRRVSRYSTVLTRVKLACVDNKAYLTRVWVWVYAEVPTAHEISCNRCNWMDGVQ